MPTYNLDLTNVEKDIYSGHLQWGGENDAGDRISFTNYYFEWNGAPYFGVSGEFQYSRFPAEYWDEEIQKMKMACLTEVATYVFWIHHEEEVGEFDWGGSKNLRCFVELCHQHGMKVFLRVGPFVHGESRNGGLPDWLFGRPFELRSNDEGYLFYVRRYYEQIAQQVKGLLFKDGGPIVNIQLENEFGHCGAPWEITSQHGDQRITSGSDGVEHMRKLLQIAREVGLEAPVYSCTGWGDPNWAPIPQDELLPTYGGYSFAPWSIKGKGSVHPPKENFVFREFHNRAIHSPYIDDPSRYPYVCCELGGGMQNWYAYRFIVEPQASAGMAIQKLAGGCNFLGYYIFHGGTNPVGKHSFMNENTTPIRTYDFQAPIREFGQITEAYKHLKRLHLFLSDFSEIITPMGTHIPQEVLDTQSDDNGPLRYAARVKDRAGFLFLSNYQDHLEMHDHPDLKFEIEVPNETIVIPSERAIDLKRDVYAILPFNLSLKGVLIKYAVAQPLVQLEVADTHYYFFFEIEEMKAEYCLDASTLQNITATGCTTQEVDGTIILTPQPGIDSIIRLMTPNGEKVAIITLTGEQALNTFKSNLWGQVRVVLSPSGVLCSEEALKIFDMGQNKMEFSVFPPIETALDVSQGVKLTQEEDGIFTRLSVELPKKKIHLTLNQPRPDKAEITLPPDAFENVSDVILHIDYLGDIGWAFIDGQFVHDDFSNGRDWEIGLKRFKEDVLAKGMYFYITPHHDDADVVREKETLPDEDIIGKRIAEIYDIRAVPEYSATIKIQP